MSKHTFSSSDGYHLYFQDEAEYQAFNKAQHDLFMRFYMTQRVRHGIWASNQNKFVRSVEELNELDGKFMENSFAKWKGEV